MIISTFRSSSCHAKSPIKTIKSINIKSSKNKIEFQFSSQSFLQHQVRSMVGCLKYLGEKKWDFEKLLKRDLSQKKEHCVLLQHHQVVYFYLEFFINLFLLLIANFLFIRHLDSALTIYPQQFFDLHLQGNCL